MPQECSLCGVPAQTLVSRNVVSSIILEALPDGLRDAAISGRLVSPGGSVEEDELSRAQVSICAACSQQCIALDEAAASLLSELAQWQKVCSDLTGQQRLAIARWSATTALMLMAQPVAESRRAQWQALLEQPDALPQRILVVAQQNHGEGGMYWLRGNYWQLPQSADSLDDAQLRRAFKVSLGLGKLMLTVAHWPTDDSAYVLWSGLHIPMWPLAGRCGQYRSDAAQFPWKDAERALLALHCGLFIGR